MNISTEVDTAAVLGEVLRASVPDLQRHCRDPWVLIGSAAAWLSGAEVTVADLDVLTSVRDAETMIEQWRMRRGTTAPPASAERFRSHFARFAFPELAVEVMGGLEVFGDTDWEPVKIAEVITVDVAGLSIPIPAIEEQIRVLESFGRPKDRQRATLLKSLCEERS
jgi:hypothetical protein